MASLAASSHPWSCRVLFHVTSRWWGVCECRKSSSEAAFKHWMGMFPTALSSGCGQAPATVGWRAPSHIMPTRYQWEGKALIPCFITEEVVPKEVKYFAGSYRRRRGQSWHLKPDLFDSTGPWFVFYCWVPQRWGQAMLVLAIVLAPLLFGGAGVCF